MMIDERFHADNPMIDADLVNRLCPLVLERSHARTLEVALFTLEMFTAALRECGRAADELEAASTEEYPNEQG